MTRPIDGQLDMVALAALAGDHDRRAQAHRPAGPALEAEIRRLHADGLSAIDVSGALRLPLDFVRTVLQVPA